MLEPANSRIISGANVSAASCWYPVQGECGHAWWSEGLGSCLTGRLGVPFDSDDDDPLWSVIYNVRT